MNKTQFDKTLQTFVKSQASLLRTAKALAEAAISHFQEHGDLGYAQQLYDAMDSNFTRRIAFVKWMVAHSPCKLEKAHWVKDRGPQANDFDLDKALSTPFWEFAPAKEVQDFSSEDLLSAVTNLLNRYQNAEKFHAKDQKAQETLRQLKKAVGTVTAPNMPSTQHAEAA